MNAEHIRRVLIEAARRQGPDTPGNRSVEVRSASFVAEIVGRFSAHDVDLAQAMELLLTERSQVASHA